MPEICKVAHFFVHTSGSKFHAQMAHFFVDVYTIAECAPAIRTKEGRNWQQYAERTTNYAFGVTRDLALQRYEKYHEFWQHIEQKKHT